jgi:hypothetical protein
MLKLEARAANKLMGYAMLLASSYTMMRTVGDSLFLSRIGSDSLASVFLASGISTAVISSIWFGLTRRVSLAITIRASGLAFAGLTFAAWVALPFLDHSWWLLAAIYLLTEIKGCVNAINVVTAMNEIMGGHSSRQSWARIGLGAPLASIGVGTLMGVEATFIDLSYWLLFSAILDLVSAVPLSKASRLAVPKSVGLEKKGGFLGSPVSEVSKTLPVYICSRQFRFWIGVLIAAKVVVLTLVTFYWKISVNEYFSGNEQSLTRYFAVFYACIGLLTLLVQGVLTGRLISRGSSLQIPILVMPVTLTILAAIVVFSTSAFFLLIILTLAKSLEIWRRSVHDTTLNLLYTNIERENRRTAIAVNSAVVKPLAEVGASICLLFGAVFWNQSVVVMGLGIWIVATAALLRLLAQRRRKLAAISLDQSQSLPSRESNIKEFVPRLFNN